MNYSRTSNEEELEKINKEYYLYEENYDWVEVTDKIVGFETFFHRLRKKNFLKFIRQNFSVNSGDKILDAGCGTGLFTRYLPISTIAIDINPRHIAKAKQNCPGVNFIVADLEKMPFADKFFTFIICTEVLEHFPNPEKPLKELQRVLNKTGMIIGTVPSRSLLWRLRFLSSTRPKEPYHHYYSKNELKILLEKYFFIESLKKTNLRSTWTFILRHK